MELAQLFQDLETLVVQQEAAVTQIEQKGEEVTENVGKGNTELDGAVVKARAARRKKWICLGIIGTSPLSELVIVSANPSSGHHHCRHRHRPCCLGSQWYAVESQEGELRRLGLRQRQSWTDATHLSWAAFPRTQHEQEAETLWQRPKPHSATRPFHWSTGLPSSHIPNLYAEIGAIGIVLFPLF